MWFCTAGGLSRFDGYVFVNFGTAQGLPHSSVNDFLETRSGEYWVATDGGLVRFDPKGVAHRGVVYENSDNKPTPLFAAIVPSDENNRAAAITVLLEARNGTIWVGTGAGLYRLEGKNGGRSLRPVDVLIPNEFPEQRIVGDMLEDESGSLWIAAPSGLYRRWPDGSSARYTTRDGLPNDYMHDLFKDHEGHLWGGTRLGGFFRLRADSSHKAPIVDLAFTYRYPFNSRTVSPYPYGLPTSWVFQLFETTDHRFWVATARGLVEFVPGAKDEGRFRTYASRNGLTDYNITSLAEDLGGNLWLGTLSAGAMRLGHGGFSTYGKQDGIETLNAIFEDQAGDLCFRGNIWGDAQRTVFEGAKLDLLNGDQPSYHTRLGCFDGRRFDWFKLGAIKNMGWAGEQVILRARNGEWWIGSGDGVYRFPPADHLEQLRNAKPIALYTPRDGLAGEQVFRLFEDSRGDVWIATTSSATKGLARWDHLDKRIHDLANSSGLPALKENVARSFGEDHSGSVWIGFGNGVARYARGTFTFFSTSQGLPPGAITDVYADHIGRLWLASEASGLIRVDNAGSERPVFFRYTTAEGLSSNNVDVIVEDLNNRLYIGGGRGLDRFDPATGRVKHFTTADGLGAGMFRAAFRDRKGVVWFGMSSGLSRLSPAIDKQSAPPQVRITALRVSGADKPVSAVGESDMSLPDFASQQNNLEIDFVGLGFASGDVLRYQHRLDGANESWSAPSEQRTVSYASLSSGTYKFVVRAVNSDGVASDHPASVAFAILPPVWLRWWFLTFAFLTITLIAYSLYRYRVTRLVEMANMRTRIATDLHDDIGANLTRIALLSEVITHSTPVESSPDDDIRLSSITRIARESVSSMSDIVWAINPKRESVLDLTRRMRQHADEIFTLRNIELRFAAPAITDSFRLAMDVRRDLLLIFKEAVNNAARHSQSSRVEIDLRMEASRLQLVVTDDGIGFDTSAESDGQGMTSMQRRAQRLGGDLDITSMIGVGTTVKLDVPVRARPPSPFDVGRTT